MIIKNRFHKKIITVIVLIFFIIVIKIIAINAAWVDKFYSSGFYQNFALLLRKFFGWIPFSIGDILYLLAALWLLKKIIIFIAALFTKKMSWNIFANTLYKILIICMGIYIIFNVFWGLNYNRNGIEYQLGLPQKEYDISDLKNIQQLLIQKVNESKSALLDQHANYPENKELFTRALACYNQCKNQYPVLTYKQSSVKSSLYGWLGNYLGFTGYYDPFTGEAQVNTTVPKFIMPYTTTHEMAHQLGYAKEDEANFAGYIAAATSSDTLFHYSTYLDLFVYTNSQIYFTDSLAAKKGVLQLLPEVRADLLEWKIFLRAHRSPVEFIVSWAYGKYLKANQQPNGLVTYNEVVGDLIAFYKKFGKI